MNYRYNPYIYAKGGLASVAEQLRQQGRGGDTMLAHINPQEAGILKALGGSGTINPRTGLPEYFNPIKEIRNVGRSIERGVRDVGRSIDDAIIQPVIGAANDVAEALGPVGQIAAAYFGGPIGAAIYAGFAAPGDDFNLKRAATAGALTYGAGQLMGGGMGFEGTPAPGGGVEMGYPNIGGDAGLGSLTGSGAEVSLVPPPSATVSNIPPTVPTTPMAATTTNVLPPLPQQPSYSMEQLVGPSADMPTQTMSDVVRSGGQTPAPIIDRSVPFDPAEYAKISTGQGIADLASAAGERAINYAAANPIQTALGATTAYGMYKSAEETKRMREEAERANKTAEEKRAADKAMAESILRQHPLNYAPLTAADVRRFGLAAGGDVYSDDDNAADGGLMSLAHGGALPPRFLAGGGDGMSDSIPARIENKQEARLADGEFVVPADVVSHIGNGSSKAGAKKLYAMMDRVRQARTGKTRQAPEINAKRLMPV